VIRLACCLEEKMMMSTFDAMMMNRLVCTISTCWEPADDDVLQAVVLNASQRTEELRVGAVIGPSFRTTRSQLDVLFEAITNLSVETAKCQLYDITNEQERVANRGLTGTKPNFLVHDLTGAVKSAIPI